MYLNLKKLTFTRDETASECRNVRKTRKTRRCGGAFSLLLPLVFATAMLLHTPVVRAVQTSVALNANTYALCQVSDPIYNKAMVFDSPDIDGILFPPYTISPDYWLKLDTAYSNTFIEGPAAGVARLVGVVYSFKDSTIKFDVDLILEDRLDPGDTGYSDACRIMKIHSICTDADPDTWHVYTTLNGTLTGLPGSDFEGAVYNVTLSDTGTCNVGDGTNPVVQVGYGACTHNIHPGVFAPLEFVLANPDDYTSLSSGPFSGELSLKILNIYEDPADIVADPDYGYTRQDNFPVPSPDLTGTWVGVVDCAGMLDFTDVETFSSSMTLKVGPQSGFNYSVELSDADGNVVATYCAEYTDDLSGGQINKGQMTNSDTGNSVLLKVRKDDSGIVTLKAREFFTIPDGDGDIDLVSDGLDFCKWTFTQIDTADPGIDPVCP